jgi:hypothetical protein
MAGFSGLAVFKTRYIDKNGNVIWPKANEMWQVSKARLETCGQFTLSARSISFRRAPSENPRTSMQRTWLPLLIDVTLLLALSGYSAGQSERAENHLKDSRCVVEVNHFARTAKTSPDVIRLQSALIDPDVPVTQQFILELAQKSVQDLGIFRPQPDTTLAQSAPTPSQTRFPSFYVQHLYEFAGKYLDILEEALPNKLGQAQVESFKTAIDSQFLRLAPMEPEIQGCFQRAAANIFPALPFNAQCLNLYSGSYPLFKSANLTAYLRQLYDSLEDHLRDSESGDMERDLRFYRSEILQRIYEEDPIVGRAIIIDEITSGAPRADIQALAILPDETLPEMDRILLRQLPTLHKSSDDDDEMAKLGVVERYATLGLLPQVKSAYLNNAGKWNSRQEALFLSYFLRTDSQFAKQVISKHMKERTSYYDSVFTDIGRVRASPELGKIARDYIDLPDRKIAADAAYIFKWVGNAEVETLLWRNLERWYKQWSANNGLIPFDEQNYQDSLVEGLLLGGGPCESKDTIDKLRSLYIKGSSIDGNIQFPEWHDPVRIFADANSPSGPKFQVDFCSAFLDLGQLKAAIPRFPKGTNFEWSGMYVLPVDIGLDPVFKELESLAKEYGMSLRPYDDQ